MLTDYVATRWYRAPELLLGPPFTNSEGVKACAPLLQKVHLRRDSLLRTHLHFSAATAAFSCRQRMPRCYALCAAADRSHLH